jgi:hypothetical protein
MTDRALYPSKCTGTLNPVTALVCIGRCDQHPRELHLTKMVVIAPSSSRYPEIRSLVGVDSGRSDCRELL